MRRLPSHSKGSDSSGPSSTPPPSPRVTLRLSQQQLKSARATANEESGVHASGGKKCKVNLAATSGAYSSGESLEGGGPDGHLSSKVKMENMEEILLKENTSAIETNPSQDETKDPLADTESVISPSSHPDKAGGGESGADKEAGGVKRGAEASNSSDEESKKKKSRREEAGGAGSGSALKSKTSNQGEDGSPKTPADNDPDAEGAGTHLNKSLDSPPCAGGVGPKVPPLKIVLPSAATTESDLSAGGSGRNGKSGTTRHAALPYVVASDIGGDVSGSAPPSPATTSAGDSNLQGGDGDKSGGIKQEVKQEPLTEEQRSTQRILRSSHSRGSSSCSPAAPDVSPPTPPSSAVPSPGAPEVSIKSEPQSSATGSSGANPAVSANTASGVDEKPSLPQVTPSEDPTPPESQHTLSSSVELHPRKRKLKHARADSSWNTVPSSGNSTSAPSGVTSTTSAAAASSGTSGAAASTAGSAEVKEESVVSGPPGSTDQQPFTNCYQLYLNIRKQIDLRRKGLFPVKPITPTKFARYLMVTCDYVLADNNSSRHSVPQYQAPACLPPALQDLFTLQEAARYKLRMQHVVEKEKLALGVEQEILRVHCHAARELANQPLPYSACTILKDEEVYNLIGPDTDDKDSLEHKRDKRTDRYRYNGRLFIKWLRDIDDKWDKIKKRMITRQTNEAESLQAVQRMDWEWRVRELDLQVPPSPQGEESYVPMVAIVDDLQSTDELAS